jgi:hypothetical protein
MAAILGCACFSDESFLRQLFAGIRVALVISEIGALIAFAT